MIRSCGVVALLLTGLCGLFAMQGEAFKPGKLSKEEVAALQPGMTLRLLQGDGVVDARRVRLAALHVPAGAAPSAAVPAGEFAARLSGYLKMPLRAEHRFRLLTRGGTATLVVNGKELLKTEDAAESETLELAKGYNRIEVGFAGGGKHEATVRLYWAGENFGFEPLPTEALFSRGDEADIVAGTRLRDGRHLYATLGCARCHALPTEVKSVALPEMKHEAPNLKEAGGRFNGVWLAKWIQDPRSLRPEATMPALLHGPMAEQKAADLAAYLTTLKPAQMLTATEGDAEQGEATFDKLGCVACHHLQELGQEDPLRRLSLFHVNAKFAPGALEAFLKAPHAHYAWIRMPDFKLDAKEAASLAAFLQQKATGAVDEPSARGDAQRGAKLFDSAGCVQCHRLDTANPMAVRLPIRPHVSQLQEGCLADSHDLKSPNFGLGDEARAALRAFLKTDGTSLTRDPAAEFSLRQVQALQCQSCHRRDGNTTRWHTLLEDEGRMPEALPALTWAGEKLRPEWAAKLIAGENSLRARPWLKARMPAFPARAALLPQGLSQEHGFAVDEDPRPAHDSKLATLGAKLIPQQGGFGCIMCHGIGATKAVSPFEAPGINLLDAAVRLRHEYYQRWMINPARVDVTTRMPVFAPDGKTTPIREVLGGDAPRQYEALWHFIQELPSK